MKIAVADAATMLNAYRPTFDGGSLRYYTAPVPANVAAGVGAATLVGTLTYASPAYAATATNVLTANAVAQDPQADVTGTIAWAGSFTSGGVLRALHTVGLVGSGADVELNTLDAIQNLPITLSSATITFPLG